MYTMNDTPASEEAAANTTIFLCFSSIEKLRQWHLKFTFRQWTSNPLYLGEQNNAKISCTIYSFTLVPISDFAEICDHVGNVICLHYQDIIDMGSIQFLNWLFKKNELRNFELELRNFEMWVGIEKFWIGIEKFWIGSLLQKN